VKARENKHRVVCVGFEATTLLGPPLQSATMSQSRVTLQRPDRKGFSLDAQKTTERWFELA
jgi:hypothetical protein